MKRLVALPILVVFAAYLFSYANRPTKSHISLDISRIDIPKRHATARAMSMDDVSKHSSHQIVSL